MLSVVAARYARALVDVIITDYGVAPKALADLRTIDAMIAGSVSLRNALLSPAVSPPRKRAVIGRLLEPLGVSKQVRNFLFVVIDHRRVHQFSSIVEAFEVLLDERMGFVRADVSSARELTEAQRAGLEGQLSRLAGKRAKLRFNTDPALLAGVVARVGSTVYDGSVRGQLERLRMKLGSG
jgi:F-type H+-transporting ATPase subunit delta